MTPVMKRCTNCRRLLEMDEFPMDRGKRYPKCRGCKTAQVMRAYYRQQERLGYARMPQ